MRPASRDTHRILNLAKDRLIDRSPIDMAHANRHERMRKARVAVLAVVAATIALALSSIALPLLQDASEAPRRALTSYVTHDFIMILDDSEFTFLNGVTGGSGTAGDPFVINGWQIDASIMGSGIMIFTTTAYYQISNVRIYGAGGTCIQLFSAPNGRVNDSLFENSDSAIIVMSSDGMSIANNTIISQGFGGIMVMDSNMTDISNNSIDQCETYGLIVTELNNVTVQDNTVTNANGFGMAAIVADNLTFARNNASSNIFCGMIVNDTRNMLVYGNDFTMNGRYGLYIGNVSTAMVFHNRFIGNPEQAVQGPNTTALGWDDGYPSGGNYWSDYIGVDLMSGPDQDISGNDGIGDTPYAFATGGTDRYPFVNEDMQLIPEFATIMVPIVGLTAVAVMLQRRKRAGTT